MFGRRLGASVRPAIASSVTLTTRKSLKRNGARERESDINCPPSCLRLHSIISRIRRLSERLLGLAGRTASVDCRLGPSRAPNRAEDNATAERSAESVNGTDSLTDF